MEFERRRENYKAPIFEPGKYAENIERFLQNEPVIYSITSKPAKLTYAYNAAKCECGQPIKIDNLLDGLSCTFHSEGPKGLDFSPAFIDFSMSCDKCLASIVISSEPMPDNDDVDPFDIVSDPHKFGYPKDQPWIVAIQTPPKFGYSKSFIACGHCKAKYKTAEDILDKGKNFRISSEGRAKGPDEIAHCVGVSFRCECNAWIESKSQSIAEKRQ